jgi:hypothetical protein
MVNLEVNKDTNVITVKRHLRLAQNHKDLIVKLLMNTAWENKLLLKLVLRLVVAYQQFKNI